MDFERKVKMEFGRKVDRIDPALHTQIPREWIEQAAYYHWERRGRPHGDHLHDWLHAEKELAEKWRATHGQAPEQPPPPESPKDHSWSA